MKKKIETKPILKIDLKRAILLMFFLTFGLVGFSQKCATDQYEQQVISNDPNYQNRKNTAEQNRQTLLHSSDYNDFVQGQADPSRSSQTDAYFKIPVVVHLIGDVAIANITTTKIQEQIQILSDDYRRRTGLNGYVGGADTQIEFCLASKDPNGNPTDGIVKVPGNFKVYNVLAAADDKELKSKSNWDNQSYLNIWVTQLSGGILGMGTFPSMYLNTADEYRDGVVINVTAFGITTDTRYGRGRTLTHEVGHWLDLKHTFGVDCSYTDLVDDTPYCVGEYYSAKANNCPSVNTCDAINASNNLPARRQIENYMDYSDDLCMNMFTYGQLNRMWSTLGGDRKNILNSKGGGCLESATCSDGIQNGTETGVDCGGTSCHACNSDDGGNLFQKCMTVKFAINGYSSDQNFVNVCSSNIILKPSRITSSCDYLNQKWLFRVSHTRLLCSNTDNMAQAAMKEYVGVLNNKCDTWWLQLFISIVEVDENRNIMPGAVEASHWPYFYDNDQSILNERENIKNINLNSYLPPNFSFTPGKYYKIKVASYEQGSNGITPWVEYNGYVRVFKDDLDITNTIIAKNQIANNITITNSNSVPGKTVDIVAKNTISIKPNSHFYLGHLYLNNGLDCNSLHSVKADEGTSPEKSNVQANYINENYTYNPSSSERITTENKTLLNDQYSDIKIYPNPATDQINIEFSLREKSKVQGFIYGLNTNFDEEIINTELVEAGVHTIKLGTDKLNAGVYFIKIVVNSKEFIKKVIIIK